MFKIMINKFCVSIVSSLLCLGLVEQATLAAPATPEPSVVSPILEKNQLQPFQLQPRFTAWGLTGDSTLIEGQFMLPLPLPNVNDQTRVLYLAMEGNYVNNDSSWLAGAGVGYRQIVNDRIWGGYVLADYVSTPSNGFIVLNPGVEMLGNIWDLNVNGYVPLSNRTKKGELGWAGDDFGDYSYGRPTGHDYYDHYLQEYEEVGRGISFEVARVIPHVEGAKLHLGAYHFDLPDAGSINGLMASLTYILNQYSAVELRDYYDNIKHNQLLIGVRFTLGGYSKEEKQQYGIATRLLDPITTKSRMLSPTRRFVDYGEGKEHDKIWYFRQSSSSSNDPQQVGSGTYEDPFIGFTSPNYSAIDLHLGVIDAYPLMYFAPGAYNFNDFSSRTISDRFNLPNGWGMYGRTNDYTAPAIGAVFYGGLDVNNLNGGDAPTTLDSIDVKSFSNSVDTTGIYAALYANNTNNLILKNDEFESSGYGIWAVNSTVNFNGGDNYVIGYERGTQTGTGVTSSYGIFADSSTINFNSGNNTIVSSDGNHTTSTSYGIFAQHSSVINFNGGTNTVTGVSSDINQNSNDSYGIWANSSNINFYGGTNTINASSINTLSLDTYSIISYGIMAFDNNINFNGGVNTVNSVAQGSSSGGQISAYGIDLVNAVVNFNDGRNTLNSGYSGSSDAFVYTIYNDDYYGTNSSVVNFNGGINAINAAGGDKSYGIYSSATSGANPALTVNFANSSQNKVTIDVSGSDEQDGIYVIGDGSHLQRNGQDLSPNTTLANMQEYIDFVGAGIGAAVHWKQGSTVILNLPWS